MGRKPQPKQPVRKAAAKPAQPILPEPAIRPDWRVALDALAVFVIALAVRLSYVAWASRNDPFFSWSRPGFDMNVFQSMADLVRSGDWLMRPQGVFYFSPIYGYFCGIVYAVIGERSFVAVHLTQTVIGAWAVALAFITARTWLGRTGGWVAGLALALAAPWLYYEQVLLHEGLMLFFYCVFLWGVRTGALGWRFRSARFVAAGIAIGLAAIGRGNAMAVLIVMAGWLLLEAGRRGPICDFKKWGWTQAGTLVLGTVIVLGAMMLRNHAVAGKWTLGMENGRVLFYLGNAIDADGTFMYSPRFIEAQTLARKNNDPSQYLKYFIQDLGNDPAHFIGLIARKTYYFFRTQDLADNMSLHLGERYILPLKLTPVRWWWLTPLGLLGLGLAWRRWRQWLPAWLFAGAFAASLILIIPVGRYRAPILLPIAIGAGFAVEWAVANWRARRLERLLWAGAGLVALGLMLAPWKTPEPSFGQKFIRVNDYSNGIRASLDSGMVPLAMKINDWGLADYPDYLPLMTSRLETAVAAGKQASPDALKTTLELMNIQGRVNQPIFNPQSAMAAAEILAANGRVEEARMMAGAVLQGDPKNERASKLLERLK